MRRLALRTRKVLLRRVGRGSRHNRRGGRGGLEREETLEDTLRLPLGGVCEVDPHVHPARPAQGRVEAFNVVCRCKQ